MLILGLTGGIATGKTSASEYFRSQNIPVVDADLLARLVVEPDKPAYCHILQQFGHLDILESNSRCLNRKHLGELIFADEKMRKQLNKCTHGYIRREALKLLIKYFFQLKSIVIWDVPLLFEVGLNRYLSHTLVISCDQIMQLNRLKQRDNITDNQQVLQRINAQMSLNEKCRRARYVIDNNDTKDILHKRLKDLLLRIQPNRINNVTWFIILCIPISFIYSLLRIWDLIDQIKYYRKQS